MRTISVAIGAAVLALAAPFAVDAAGLGRLTVLSSLGAPLNAEIELVSLQPGEEDGLTARIASLDAFREAGIEPSGALSGVRFAIMRRDGKPIIRVTSSQPINEPFVDLLVELEWSGGRLLREYTFLLDPPEYRRGPALAAVPAAAPAAAPAATPPERAAGPIAHPLPALETKPEAGTPAPAPVPTPSAPKAVVANSHEVRRGDTLGEIARAHLPSGVSLNQMLIAIYRANQEAFLRENINLVRTGRILQLPTAETASGIDVEEANRLVLSHRADWDDYRSRLAAQPVRVQSASGQRAVSGRIEAKPEATTPAAAQEEVRLAKADPAKPGAGGRAARADDTAARERALTEAQSRVSDLEKNVADLQKLLELKNQQLAELEKKAAKPGPVAAAPAPPAAAQPEPKTARAPVVVEAPKPAPEAKKAEPVKPKAKAAPPPPPAPSLLDEFLENPIAMAGLGSVALLLLGYGLWSWRRKKATQAKFSDSVIGAGSGPASSFNEAGKAGAGASGSQASVSQSSGMEAEEVDPIAEADVYMAYGRDAQAEEILKEALQKDPSRLPVHAKLLEIYAKRSDAPAFEQTALKLKNLTHGSGPDWDKAVALGRSIDPGNGLYGGMSGGTSSGAGALAAAPSIDFDIGGATSPGMVITDIPLDDPQPKPVNLSSIDFDLGSATGTHATEEKAASDFASGGTLKLDKPDLDATVTSLDFDLNTGAPEKKPGDASGLDFDLNLDLGEKGGEAEKSAPPMDLSSISLDLGSPGEPGAPSSNDPKWQEVATKLDLAKAYEEMGDKDGARELLGEVMKDGDAAQKGQAEQLLTKLG